LRQIWLIGCSIVNAVIENEISFHRLFPPFLLESDHYSFINLTPGSP
jgi:hypothetical protein